MNNFTVNFLVQRIDLDLIAAPSHSETDFCHSSYVFASKMNSCFMINIFRVFFFFSNELVHAKGMVSTQSKQRID